MSTFTSRLQLEKPSPSDLMSDGGTTLAANYIKIDDVAGFPLVTSATRPGTPFTGQTIRESDTQNNRFWDGSKWAYFGNESNQREDVLLNTDSTSLTATAETVFRSQSFTATNGRRYRIDFCSYIEIVANVTARAVAKIRWANGASVTTASTLLYSDVIQVNSAGVTGRSIRDFTELNYTGVTGQITIGWFFENIDAQSTGYGLTTDGMDVESSFAIRDWGD